MANSQNETLQQALQAAFRPISCPGQRGVAISRRMADLSAARCVVVLNDSNARLPHYKKSETCNLAVVEMARSVVCYDIVSCWKTTMGLRERFILYDTPIQLLNCWLLQI